MTERVLRYDHAVVPQERSWDCAPASTQVVLNTRGIYLDEDAIVAEINARLSPAQYVDVNGTDYVGLLEKILDPRLPDAKYTSVYLSSDPANAAQKATLWTNIVRSIDAGYGVVMNWDSPPDNPPRAIKGSTSPVGYGSHEIFHYVACMGYDDNYDGNRGRAVWIADPGFKPFGYWITFDQCATLIPPKGYCFADQPLASTPVPTPLDPVRVLSEVMGDAVTLDRYRALLPAVSQCLAECECTTVARIAMWAAQTGEESGGLRWMEEIASGSEYEGRKDLGNIYAGDGIRFKGRGPIQVTGRLNYTMLSKWAHARGLVPDDFFFVTTPTALSSDQYGFMGVTWYWMTQRPMNAAADAGDIETASIYVNGRNPQTGRANGIEDRIARYNRALAMGDRLLALLEGDDMFTDDDRMLLRQISEVRRPSLSPFRWPGEGPVNTCAGFAWSADGNVHIGLVETLAVKYGDPQHVAMLIAVASCAQYPLKYPDRQSDALLAARILRKVDEDAHTAGEAYLKAWFDAEQAHQGT